ncbi:hypothetical protein NEUTE1DRAFT_130947 [Neurospora tetrasperma FGSC 2508]|uniref:Heterokaryon incompatibility domain-containing protein n=1 Tax=Neurospora tetrasperma (strain FGSC 2508 / ATCC MYA-4615 / P0657) TaxID=510951 RepID=F8MSB4_NEUT8|nr:uncharacterized protein NEUTE1DRAFT_130947 [Neurospora tetrasperma FGSC 2508]EGO55055.1 hypothetical protein NEUTE1DRAFT_130947 [Neurospora tetrasperma FGSC 2508]EGZ69739.1 hypothetical protein NEUTE2DRAFT_160094 [Neurospora tetrasperma FGSC 2509]
MDNNTSPSSLPPQHQELSYTTIPLNTPATEIRLLELYPSADFSSPLHCRLYTTPIARLHPSKPSPTQSDADASLASGLSAVDISSDDNEVDTVDGGRAGADALNGEKCIIRITTSLDTCLRHLRAIHHRDHPSAILTLWIDQLCIDQSDSDEKAVQVGLMSQIYSRAKQVLIWLGPAADGSDEVMDVLAELGKEFEIVGIRLGDLEKILKLTNEYVRNSLRISAEGNVGEKRKERIGVTKEKEVSLPLGKEIDCGIGVEGGTGTTCGGDGVVNAPGGGDATAGNSDEVEIGVELGLGVDVTDIEALDEAAVVCTTNKADASTGKTVVAVVEDGAARLGRMGVSGELQAFFRRPWFTRLWVVQEACHCADTVFVCGTKPPVSYDILGTIPVCTLRAVQWPGHKRNDMSDWGGVSPICTHRKIAGVGVSDDVAEAFDGLSGYTFRSYLTRRTIQQISKGVGGDDLFTLLVGTYTRGNRGGETTLYRDRIYALLGLATDINQLEFQPDYSSQTSTAQILTDVAKAIISKTKREFPVEVLSYSQFPKTILDDGSDEQLPSWVPDWRSDLRYPFYYSLSDTDMFMACGPHRSVDMVPTTPASVLGLRGYLVDTIEEVVVTSTINRWRESIEFFEKWDKLWELSKQKNKPIYATPARREEALWRVPVGDITEDWQKDTMGDTRAKAGFALEYQKWRRTLEDEKKKATSTVYFLYELDADKGYYYRSATGKMIGMRLYLTKEGYMGMGPSNMQPGDVVVVFPGARIPFVLRPTDEDNTFTYVGDAYCDGIMDGEIIFREERRDFFLV